MDFPHAHVADFTGVWKRGTPILGFVGWKFFKGKEIVVDYTLKTLTVYELDLKGDRLNQDTTNAPLATVPFKWNGSLPVHSGSAWSIKTGNEP